MGTPRLFPRSAFKLSSQRIWLLNTVPKFRDSECATSCSGTGRLSSFDIEVTGLEVIPQGTIKSKKLKSVFTLSATPWEVTPREMWTPSAAILDSGLCANSEPCGDGRRRPSG